jgi:quercetin dioxygenase-like cupin family protein
VQAFAPHDVELSDAWISGDHAARWRSASLSGSGTGAQASGASLLEIPRGCRLPRHTDSAEEVVVVVQGAAELVVGGERRRLPEGGMAVVPECEPHEVRNCGDGSLRFLAIYAAPEVTTTYDEPIQPGGDRERTSTA